LNWLFAFHTSESELVFSSTMNAHLNQIKLIFLRLLTLSFLHEQVIRWHRVGNSRSHLAQIAFSFLILFSMHELITSEKDFLSSKFDGAF
jgi:hypothetical protein